LSPEVCILIEQQEPLSPAVRPCFPHLLHDPEGTGIPRNVEAQNSPAIVSNDEEAVQDTERKRRQGHGGFRNRETKLLQLAVDTRRSPGRVLPMRKTSSRTSLPTGLRSPTRLVQESHFQYSRKLARCHATTVRGVTSIRSRMRKRVSRRGW